MSDQMHDWETYTIWIVSDGDLEQEGPRGDVTDRFETDLVELIEKYQGPAGLKITATNSLDEPIRKW